MKQLLAIAVVVIATTATSGYASTIFDFSGVGTGDHPSGMIFTEDGIVLTVSAFDDDGNIVDLTGVSTGNGLGVTTGGSLVDIGESLLFDFGAILMKFFAIEIFNTRASGFSLFVDGAISPVVTNFLVVTAGNVSLNGGVGYQGEDFRVEGTSATFRVKSLEVEAVVDSDPNPAPETQTLVLLGVAAIVVMYRRFRANSEKL